MKRKNKSIEHPLYEEGSRNVFADLDMHDAQVKLVKASLALRINNLLQQKKLKQKDAAELLEIDQSKISLLNRGRLSAFSIERLIRFLSLLSQDVDIVIRGSTSFIRPGKLTVKLLDVKKKKK